MPYKITSAKITAKTSEFDFYKDYPIKGVEFIDIFPWIKKNVHALSATLGRMIPDGATHIAGIEARGFIPASLAAGIKNLKLIPIRKKGRLPGPKQVIYAPKEYGGQDVEMYKGEGNLVIIDDVIATGGTLKAAKTLAEDAGFKVLKLISILNITNLNNIEADSIFDFELMN